MNLGDNWGIRTVLLAAFSCSAPSVNALELANPGFEEEVLQSAESSSWQFMANDQRVEQDSVVFSEGAASLRVSGENPQSSTMLLQQFTADAVREDSLLFSGKIKTKGIQGTATLFLVVNGSDSRLFVDDMRGRPIQGDTDWTLAEIRVPRLLDAQSIELGALVIGPGTAWFDDFQIRPLELDQATSPEAESYLNSVLDVMQSRSVAAQTANWDVIRENARLAAEGSQTTADTYPAIRYVLRLLDDKHSTLLSPEFAQQRNSESSTSQPLPRWESPSGSVSDDGIASISVPSFSGSDSERLTAYADELQARIAEIDSEHVCGWIVDLRENTGGNVFAMLAGIGPVLGEGDAGGGMDVDGNEIMYTYRSGQSGRALISGTPYELETASPPVAVLIGPDTASSGEAVALAFVGRPDTQMFGGHTAGYTTGNVPISLSDGAVLNLAVTTMMDRNRQLYRGPIAPDILVTEADDSETGIDAVKMEATKWLRAMKACAR